MSVYGYLLEENDMESVPVVNEFAEVDSILQDINESGILLELYSLHALVHKIKMALSKLIDIINSKLDKINDKKAVAFLQKILADAKAKLQGADKEIDSTDVATKWSDDINTMKVKTMLVLATCMDNKHITDHPVTKAFVEENFATDNTDRIIIADANNVVDAIKKQTILKDINTIDLNRNSVKYAYITLYIVNIDKNNNIIGIKTIRTREDNVHTDIIAGAKSASGYAIKL